MLFKKCSKGVDWRNATPPPLPCFFFFFYPPSVLKAILKTALVSSRLPFSSNPEQRRYANRWGQVSTWTTAKTRGKKKKNTPQCYLSLIYFNAESVYWVQTFYFFSSLAPKKYCCNIHRYQTSPTAAAAVIQVVYISVFVCFEFEPDDDCIKDMTGTVF